MLWPVFCGVSWLGNPTITENYPKSYILCNLHLFRSKKWSLSWCSQHTLHKSVQSWNQNPKICGWAEERWVKFCCQEFTIMKGQWDCQVLWNRLACKKQERKLFNWNVLVKDISIILKQWIALNSRADWLVKLRISCAIYLWATREKRASRFASVTSEENIQINFLCCILSHCFSIY